MKYPGHRTIFIFLGMFFLFLLGAASGAEVTAPKWRLIDTKYPTLDTVVVPYTIADFGVDASGKSDSTAVVQKALGEIAKLGGGTLWFPAGVYRFDGSLVLAAGVSIRGEWRDPSVGKIEGQTIFALYAGRGIETNVPFINVATSSALNGVVFWYPDQSPSAPVAYPPTIACSGGSVENATFVNSWRALTSDPSGNSLYFFRNIFATALSVGMDIDAAYDIGRIENVHFSPNIWSASGLAGAPAAGGAHTKWIYENASGIVMRRNDWSYLYDASVDGYAYGFRSLVSLGLEDVRKNKKAYANGWNDQLGLENCRTAIDVENASAMGLAFSHLRVVRCENGLVCGPAFDGRIQMHTARFAVSHDAIRVGGPGLVMLASGKVESGKISFDDGHFLLTDSDLDSKKSEIVLGQTIKSAVIAGNRFSGETTIRYKPVKNIVVDPKPLVAPSLPVYPYRKPDAHAPAKRKLFCVTDDAFGAKGDGATDDSSALRKALEAAGKNEGGVVFFPPGEYRISESFTVPEGVELRGTFDSQHRMEPKGSVISVVGGRGEENGTPTFRLLAHAGIRGLNFHYPDQQVSTFVPYTFLIRGAGSGVYVVNTTASCVYQFIDLATEKCDDHFVDYAAGAPLKAGILVGGGAERGRVYNSQFNPSYFTFTKTYGNSFPRNVDRSPLFKAYHSFEWTNQVAFGFGNCRGEIIHGNFVFGSKYGLWFHEENGAGPQFHGLGNGVDQSMFPIFIDGTGTNRVNLLNLQLCTVKTVPADKKVFIEVSARQKAPVSIFNGTMVGGGDVSLHSEGAMVNLVTTLLRGRSDVALKNGPGKIRAVNVLVENAEALVDEGSDLSGIDFTASLAETKVLREILPRWPGFLPVGSDDLKKTIPITAMNKLSGIVITPSTPKSADAGRFELVGDWNGEWTSPKSGRKAIWRPNIPRDENYLVEIYYFDDPNKDHATSAPYSVQCASGRQTFSVNQRTNTQEILPLGVFPFKAGSEGYLELDAGKANANVVHGAARFIRAPDFVDGKNRALWIAANVSTNGVELVPQTDEGKLTVVAVRDGAPAWTVQPGKASGKYLYGKLSDESFRGGKTPFVTFLIRYFDEGTAKVNLNYDSLDEAKTGAYKSMSLFQLENTKTWKTAKVALSDARFGGRCNGADFRIGLPKDDSVLISAVAVIQNSDSSNPREISK